MNNRSDDRARHTNHSNRERTRTPGSARVASGKRTLTSDVPARSGSAATFVQRQRDASVPVQRRPNPDTERWMDVAMRPDLHAAPVQRTASPGSARVVQRSIDLSTLASTENQLYHTEAAGGVRLVSTQDAAAPEPPALYGVADDTSTEGADLKVWQPRSKLADKKKLRGETPVHDSSGTLLEDLHEINDTVLAQIIAQVDAQIDDRQGDTGLRLGTAGINDCKGFALTLRALISHYGQNPQGMVGGMWLHETEPDKADFPYHGATVVAEDGTDAVTLEAHAGQDITEPRFHIRTGGKAGFEAANHISHPDEYQEKAHEVPRQAPEEAREMLDALKDAWTDETMRSDKSAVRASGPVQPPQSSGINWSRIGNLLGNVLSVFQRGDST